MLSGKCCPSIFHWHDSCRWVDWSEALFIPCAEIWILLCIIPIKLWTVKFWEKNVSCATFTDFLEFVVAKFNLIQLFFIIQGFQTIVFTFIVIFVTFRLMCPYQLKCCEYYNHHHHCHHHHHVVLVARISLTLSRYFSLSFIASGRSSGLHPVSSHSCWMYIRAGRPALLGHVWGSMRVHHLQTRWR